MDKHHGLSTLDKVDVLHFLKLYFSGLKIILFSPEYQKTTFSDLISLKNTNKKNFDFWTKTMDYPLRKMAIFFRPFKTLVFWCKIYSFLSRIPRNDLFEHNFFKNTNEKKFEFWAKTNDLLGKDRFFGAPQDVTFLV